MHLRQDIKRILLRDGAGAGCWPRFHGHDERISLANLRLGVPIMFETLSLLTA